jgi:hypothetical protein
MEIDEGKREKIKDFLRHRWINQSCVVCNQIAWSLSPNIYEIGESARGDKEGQVFSIILIFCNNCGFTLSFKADVLGAAETEEEAK